MALKMLFARDRHQAADVLNRITELAGDPANRSSILEAQMIFHTTWGSFDDAIVAARELIGVHRTEGDATALFRALCNAAYPLRASGRIADARAHLIEALDLAEHHRLHLSKSRAIPMLAHMALEQGLTEEAKHWLAELESINTSSDDQLARDELISIRARVALIDRRFTEARVFVNDLEQMRSDTNQNRRVYAAALRVVVELANDHAVLDSSISELEEAHLQSRGNVFQAFAAYALFAGLSSLGQEKHAVELLHEYLTEYRRETTPPPSHLLKMIMALKEQSGPNEEAALKPRD
jgi:hypothetical protein